MIYFCADDYGLDDISSMHIKECIDAGALNKVSVFPNFDKIELHKLLENKNIYVSLHLNLVEGKCIANRDKLNLIADENGCFRHTFGGLFKLNLLKPKELENQAYKEIRAQVLLWKSILPDNASFYIDSHQHIHMIPSVFNALVRVLKDENINLRYIRIPAEPIMPYLKMPSLYHTYSAVNIIKQWLLNFLWLVNKKHSKEYNIPISYFFGILFSGKMTEKRVNKVLPEYIKLAERDGCDIEVLFHPGYMNKPLTDKDSKNIMFEKFYLSENRKTEFDSVMNISANKKAEVHSATNIIERSVHK